MSTIQEQVGYEHIRLYWPYEAQSLQEVRIIRKMNDHATLYVSGILPEEQGEQCIRSETDREPIAIRQLDTEGREVRRLFHGVLTDLAVHRVNGVYRFELEAISHSSQLDWKLRRRSFQNVDLTYSALLDQILADYPYADVIDMASGTAKIKEFTLQYDETDWAFLKRMAARFGTVVIPEVTAASPKVFFGVPEGRLWKIEEESSYRLKKILGHVRLFDDDHDRDGDFNRDLNRRDITRDINSGRAERAGQSWTDGESTYGYTAYIMESHSHYALGDSIILGDGGELKVAAAETRMQDAILTTTYQLVPEEQLKQRPLTNKRITGVTLSGKVLDVKQDEVQLQLTIDEGETPVDASSKCWFPVATAYIADGQSGLYSMPERGDLAQLYIPSAWEEQAYVQGSISQQTGQMEPGEKVWGTTTGKEVRLGQQELKLSASEGLFISMNDGDILIESSGNVALSGGALQVKAGDKLNVQAGQAIYLRGGSSSMILDGETDIKSPSIQQTGSVKAPVFVADLSPAPEPPLMTIEAYEAAQAAATPTPTITAAIAPDQGALLKVGLALLGMVPVIGPIVKAVTTNVSLGMLGATPKVGSMKSLALQFFGGFINHLKDQKAEENYYSSMFWGKVFTSARHLKSPTSLKELLLQMNQAMKEIETSYYEIPDNIRERWIQREDNRKLQRLQDGVNVFNEMRNTDPYYGMFATGIRDKFGLWITDDQIGSYEYWLSLGYTPEYLEYIGTQLMTPTTVEELYELDRNFRDHQALLAGVDTEFRGVKFSKSARNIPEVKFTPFSLPPKKKKPWFETKGYKPKPGERTTTKEEYKKQDQKIREAAGEGHKPNLFDKDGNYTGGRTHKELDDLAGDPSHGGKIRDQGLKEREIGLDLEQQGKLGNIIRDPQENKGAEFIDVNTGQKWDVKSFESYPHGHTSPKKGAFTVKKSMDKIYEEFDRGHNVIIDTRELIPEHVKQLKEAIEDAGVSERIIWYP